MNTFLNKLNTLAGNGFLICFITSNILGVNYLAENSVGEGLDATNLLALLLLIIFACTCFLKILKLIKTADKSTLSAKQCLPCFIQLILLFALAFSVLEMHSPCSFSGLGENEFISRTIAFIYFSLMIFTTVGFGDITPNTEMARAAIGSEILVAFSLLVIAVNFFRGDKEEAEKEEEDTV